MNTRKNPASTPDLVAAVSSELTPAERRILDAARKLPEQQQERLAERVEGWVEAMQDRTPQT